VLATDRENVGATLRVTHPAGLVFTLCSLEAVPSG
jgi:hypothetical protein